MLRAGISHRLKALLVASRDSEWVVLVRTVRMVKMVRIVRLVRAI